MHTLQSSTPIPDELFFIWARLLPGDEFKLLLYIAYRANEDTDLCFTEAISALCEATDLTAQRCYASLSSLQQLGIITVRYASVTHVWVKFIPYAERWPEDLEDTAPAGSDLPSIEITRSNPIYARDGRVCQYCGTTEAAEYQLDHVVPRSQGGPSARYNLVVACRPCNQRKKDRTWIPNNLTTLTERFPEWAARIQREAVPRVAP